MLQFKSNAMRSIAAAVAAIFLLVSLLACTESVSAASGLKVRKSKKTVYVGQTLKLRANKNVKWSLSKKKIVRLTKVRKKTVTVKALKAGKVCVRAKAGNKTKKIKIIVKPAKLKLTATADIIGIGEYSTVSVKSAKPASAAKNVVYSSGNSSVATVSKSGLVKGVSKGEVTITAKSKKNKKAIGKIKIIVAAAKMGTVTLNADLTDESRYPAGKTAKVWLPVPQTDRDQIIASVRFDAPSAKDARITEDSSGGKQLYVEWGEDAKPAERKATLSYHVYRREVVRRDDLADREKGSVDAAAFADDLKQTQWSGSLTSGIVKETADSIVANAGAKTVYDKAHAIYNWVCDNVTRIDDKNVIYGDVVSMLSGTRKAGSCMDVNSIFVALCRAEGIPARNMFGMRFTPKYGPNCRAEFYLPGYGWVPADPALAIKQSWGHESEYIGSNAPNAATWAGIKDKYWGNAEENWLCNNRGRDITLTPPQSAGTGEYLDVLNPDGTINLYMFPYGEFDGKYIPCQKPAEFKYEYSFAEEDPIDCGC